MDNLITYRIDSSRKQAPLKLLIQLSRALTMDGIDLGAQKAVKNAVLSKKEYWIRHSTRDHIDVKKEIIILTNDTDAMERINDYAEKEFISLYENNKRSIARLSEARKNVYERLTNASAQPISVPWILPDSIDFYMPDNSMKFGQHLYCSEDGTFETSLNTWEIGVITEELNNGAVCWLRNLDRKKWALEIPYKVSGVTTSMFPDLVIIRADSQGYHF